ncbi:hypothetical protein HK405_011596, partial [Cladochytrium tenue]
MAEVVSGPLYDPGSIRRDCDLFARPPPPPPPQSDTFPKDYEYSEFAGRSRTVSATIDADRLLRLMAFDTMDPSSVENSAAFPLFHNRNQSSGPPLYALPGGARPPVPPSALHPVPQSAPMPSCLFTGCSDCASYGHQLLEYPSRASSTSTESCLNPAPTSPS